MLHIACHEDAHLLSHAQEHSVFRIGAHRQIHRITGEMLGSAVEVAHPCGRKAVTHELAAVEYVLIFLQDAGRYHKLDFALQGCLDDLIAIPAC